jgi:hypothetical protein
MLDRLGNLFSCGHRVGSGAENYAPQAQGLRTAVERFLGGHPIFDQPNDRRQDRTGNATASELADERADVDGARGLSKKWNDSRQNLPANAAANCAGNRVTSCSETEILRCSTGHIATDCASNDLHDEVDESA